MGVSGIVMLAAVVCPRAALNSVRKLTENRLRDQRNQRKLRKLGWSVLVVWECELGKPDAVRDRIKAFLEGIA